MAPKKPSHGKLRTGDDAGIAVLTLCLGHSAGFPLITSVLPEFCSEIPQAEILSRLLAVVAFFLSIVVLSTGFCHHQDRGILARCGLGSILLLVVICGLVDCRCAEPSAAGGFDSHSGLLNAVLPSAPCLILISAHVQNRRTLWALLQQPRQPERRRLRRFIV